MASRAYSNAQEAAPNDEHLIIHGSSQQDAANLKHDASSSHRELAAGLSVQVRCVRTHLYTKNSICPAIERDAAVALWAPVYRWVRGCMTAVKQHIMYRFSLVFAHRSSAYITLHTCGP